MASYQFGWSGQGAGQGGKFVRAALALACARAVGGSEARAVPAAAAVEMVHNLSLLYDDVLDGDAVRRHRTAAWKVFGSSAAARSADALLLSAFDVLADGEAADGPGELVSREASAVLLEALIQLAVGESLDLVFEGRSQVALAECLEMVSGKTASLFACSCRLGALYGGADSAAAVQWAAFGHDLGMAFQLVDDLLGIWGDPAVTGKPVFNDLRRRKMSVPVVAALASGTAPGEELVGLYGTSDADPGRLARLVEEAGGRSWTQERAAQHARDARERLHRLTAVPEALAALEALCTVIVSRVH
ncbi:polyprenyl synthetase family protein [Streptomyces sp. ASQP_92]|uniref:polyprenyl synthetase family protein n=1 Tax=Streptomyces sp. ASQP_92 TaxID=2979116 RepID=UPI0021BFD724|nr:polyprenyl synthetase family protein [Streptomyces sp. ASQP_92]MCT9094159.1 polyprenyl synthetase family protein [Streptomyces sp. ASQP_92]